MEAIKKAAEIKEIVVTKAMKARQKELKEQYRKALEKYVWASAPDMVDFCVNEVLWIAELSNGMLVPISKEKIETRFCFGFRLSSYGDDGSYDAAGRMAQFAREDVNHFIEKNMDGFQRWLSDLRGEGWGWSVPYLRVKYLGLPNDSNIRSLNFMTGARYGFDNYIGKEGTFVQDGSFIDYVPSADDVQTLIEAHEIAQSLHYKKVMSYLKRYGLSKVNTWTYWEDA